MAELLVTDVLVVGEGCAGQTAALAASEEGCDRICHAPVSSPKRSKRRV
jgi:succinate dehydrogenase/fumarate reductase flavoprotein subunit